MKHLRLFETTAEFETAKPTLEEPWVALTEDDEKINYGGGGEPTPTDEFVDLGLPSGLKWAKCNVGAETETDYGKYFQWGDVEGRTADEIADKPCNWSTAPFNNGSSSYDSSYFTAHKSEWLNGDVLKPQYDAATQLMGEGWRMPTEADFNELLANTNKEWVTNYNDSGKNGYLFRSQKDMDKYIFIPAAGVGDDGSVGGVGNGGDVWSSSLDASGPDNGLDFYFYSGGCDVGNDNRYYGFSVRGVRS